MSCNGFTDRACAKNGESVLFVLGPIVCKARSRARFGIQTSYQDPWPLFTLGKLLVCLGDEFDLMDEHNAHRFIPEAFLLGKLLEI